MVTAFRVQNAIPMLRGFVQAASERLPARLRLNATACKQVNKDGGLKAKVHHGAVTPPANLRRTMNNEPLPSFTV